MFLFPGGFAMTRAVIFANGDLPNPGAARLLIAPDDALIAADGGARHALKLGLIPSVILGDFDSLSEVEVRIFTDMGVHMLRYPTSKDETDLELALQHALNVGYSPILLLGALGGRLDQTLGNLALLSAPECIRAGARLDDGETEAFFIDEIGVVTGQPGDTVSLIPWGGTVDGITTDGLCYLLHQESLSPQRTRGISNEMLAETAKIYVKSGLLLCVHQRKK